MPMIEHIIANHFMMGETFNPSITIIVNLEPYLEKSKFVATILAKTTRKFE